MLRNLEIWIEIKKCTKKSRKYANKSRKYTKKCRNMLRKYRNKLKPKNMPKNGK